MGSRHYSDLIFVGMIGVVGTFIVLYFEEFLFEHGAWCIDGDSHCVREWVGALSGWAAAAAAGATIAVLWQQVLQARRSADLTAEGLRISIQQARATLQATLSANLQEGERLISPRGSQSKIIAGLGLLREVIVAEDERYAETAMDLVANYLQLSHRGSHDHQLARTAIAALNAGADVSRYSKKALTFEAPPDKDAHPWLQVRGVERVTYKNGTAPWGIMFENPWHKTVPVFDGVLFYLGGNVAVDNIHFKQCKFLYCNIIEFDSQHIHVFEQCNFSGCKFVRGYILGDLRYIPQPENLSRPGAVVEPPENITAVSVADGRMRQVTGNWFDPANPPSAPIDVPWRSVLNTAPTRDDGIWESINSITPDLSFD